MERMCSVFLGAQSARAVRRRRLNAFYRLPMFAPSAPIPQLAEESRFSGAEQFHRAYRIRFCMTLHEARHERPTHLHGDAQFVTPALLVAAGSIPMWARTEPPRMKRALSNPPG